MLAAVGLCAYTPNLQGLCMMDPESTDIDSIRDLLKTLVKEHKSQIGLIGFSFGGTYALLASSSPEIAETIRFVLAVGAYYSLESVVERAFSLRGGRDLSQEAGIALLVLDWKFRQMLPLTDEESIAFEELMDHSYLREKHFTPEDTALVAKITSLQQQEDIYLEWKKRLPEISCLNIEGNPALESLEAPVFLLHSENDTYIPVEESLHIADRLACLDKNVLRHIGRSGDHLTFSVRSDAELAQFFYRIMLLTEPQDARNPGSNGRRGSTDT
jgi:pimeloyl-ACP methyl ester carboxylesterase